MRTTFLLLLCAGTLSAAEPSAFGAGDLDSPNPYGLTDSEKHILKNKESLTDVKRNTRDTQTKVQSLRERMDGLQSIVEGMSETAYKNQNELNQLKETMEYDRTERAQSAQELETLVKANEQNIVQLKAVLEEFSGMLDTINSNYVTKSEYNTLVAEVKKLLKTQTAAAKPAAFGGSGSPLDKMSNAEVAKEAEALYKKKYYTQAIDYYEHLIEKHYKPARAHYMIGDMWYKRKDYGQAIAYFKKSAKLYNKADYMPQLLLHTAISMQATKDSTNAKKFYRAVIDTYPASAEASTASARLAELP
jgi:TolA-binding protein